MADEWGGVDAVAGRSLFEHWKGGGHVEALDGLDRDQIANAAEKEVNGRRLAELIVGIAVERQHARRGPQRDPHPKLRRLIRPAKEFLKITIVGTYLHDVS